jgi:hypothetical protein
VVGVAERGAQQAALIADALVLEWQARVAAWRASGETAEAFAAGHGFRSAG